MKTTSYDLLERQLSELLAMGSDIIANAANFSAFIYHELPEINWAGFYFVQPSGELLLGPFCGRPACARLPAGRGVCGVAATQRLTIVVDDVSRFADHIACDGASRSELVVPVFLQNDLFGVFDCDSPQIERFSDADRTGIERLVRTFCESVEECDLEYDPRRKDEAVKQRNGRTMAATLVSSRPLCAKRPEHI
jgi:GAF domain-containing protein